VESEGRGITTSQLRNIFSKVKSVEDDNKLQLMRPLLAYTAARQGTQQAKIIIALLDALIQDVDDKDKLKSFKTFMESIVGFHKYHHKQ
jgi:CRISPR type III-A-associated protein Csm2